MKRKTIYNIAGSLALVLLLVWGSVQIAKGSMLQPSQAVADVRNEALQRFQAK